MTATNIHIGESETSGLSHKWSFVCDNVSVSSRGDKGNHQCDSLMKQSFYLFIIIIKSESVEDKCSQFSDGCPEDVSRSSCGLSGWEHRANCCLYCQGIVSLTCCPPRHYQLANSVLQECELCPLRQLKSNRRNVRVLLLRRIVWMLSSGVFLCENFVVQSHDCPSLFFLPNRQELRGRWLGGRRPLLVLVQRNLAVREEGGEHGFISTPCPRQQVCRSEPPHRHPNLFMRM